MSEDYQFIDSALEWLKQLPSSVKRVEPRTLPEHELCRQLDADSVAALLSPDGALAKHISGYEARPGQLAMLRAVIDAFNQEKHLVVEAGTGIGKSLAYLLPAAVWAKINHLPVVISTNTRNLQTQLTEKDLPAVLLLMREAFPDTTPLRFALVKGRTNYVCLRRFKQLLEYGMLELHDEDFATFPEVVAWVRGTQDGDLDALDVAAAAGIRDFAVKNLTCTSEECSGRACKFFSRCFLQRAREKSLRADLVIANHALVFTELDNLGGRSLPVHAQIIFDEAHNLEQAATDYFSAEFTPGVLNQALRRLLFQPRGATSPRGLLVRLEKLHAGGASRKIEGFAELIQETRRCVERLRRRANELFRALRPICGANREPKRFFFEPPTIQAADNVSPVKISAAPNAEWEEVRRVEAEFQSEATKLIAALKDIAAELDTQNEDDELSFLSEEAADIAAAMKFVEELLATERMILAGDNPGYVYWVAPSFRNNDCAEVFSAPLNVGPLLASQLYSKRRSVIMCSASLTVEKNFDYISSRIGLNHVDRSRVIFAIAPSPFDYARQCRLLAPSYLPDPARTEDYVAELSRLILRLALHFGGRTLVLFTSYEMMNRCGAQLEPLLADDDIRLLVHGKSGSRSHLTEQFRRDERTVLLGTHSFWEGVDVVGEALSCVIVARLPFASPGEPILKARGEQLQKEGRSDFFELSLPMAVLRLRQGFGRLIRHRNDRGVVVIADNRLHTKGYGRTFRNSLPCTARLCQSEDEILWNAQW